MLLNWCFSDSVSVGTSTPCFIDSLISSSEQPLPLVTFRWGTMACRTVLKERDFHLAKEKKDKFLGMTSWYHNNIPSWRAVTMPTISSTRTPQSSINPKSNCLNLLTVDLLNKYNQDFVGFIGVTYPLGEEIFKTMVLTPCIDLWTCSYFLWFTPQWGRHFCTRSNKTHMCIMILITQ